MDARQFADECKSHTGNQKEKKSGGWIKVCCPGHSEKTPSLSIKDGDEGVVFNCHAGCNKQDILSTMGLSFSDIFYNPRNIDPKKKFCLEEFAAKKKFPVDFLQSMGFGETEGKYGNTLIAISNGEGFRARHRSGYKGKETFWAPLKPGKKAVYTAYEPVKIEGDELFIVEGETDTLSFVYRNIAAVGIQGVSFVHKSLRLEHVENRQKIYVIKEPGEAGHSFIPNVRVHLATLGYKGELFVIDMHKTNYGDVHEVHEKSPDKFKQFWEIQKQKAEPLQVMDFIEIGIAHKFRVYKDHIVYMEETKTDGTVPRRIINQRVVVDSVYRDAFNDECSAVLKWGNRKRRFDKRTLLWRNSHKELSAHGILADSENSKYLVLYFNQCISELEPYERTSSSRNGWTEDGYIFGNLLINEHGIKEVDFNAVGYKPMKKGERKQQVEVLNYIAKDAEIALKLGACAISPLNKKIGCHPFTMHTWGDSSRGKTIGSKGGISLYTCPVRGVRTWEASSAGFEVLAKEAGGLPISLEESHKAKPAKVVKTLYDFGNGQPSIKAQMVNGVVGLREPFNLEGVILSTGEGDISSLTNSSGAQARLVEMHKTFLYDEEKGQKLKSAMAKLERNYGHLGQEVFEYYFANKDKISSSIDDHIEELYKSSHKGLQERQIPYFASCLVGCEILKELGIDMPSMEELRKCCLATMSTKPKTLFDKAMEYLRSTLNSKYNFFAKKCESVYGLPDEDPARNGEILGIYEIDKDIVHFFPSTFNKILADNEMQRNSVIKCLKENGALIPKKMKNGEVRNSTTIWFNGKSVSVYSIKIKNEEEDDNDDGEKAPPPKPQPKEEPPQVASYERSEEEKNELDEFLSAGYDYSADEANTVEGVDKNEDTKTISFYYYNTPISREKIEKHELVERCKFVFKSHQDLAPYFQKKYGYKIVAGTHDKSKSRDIVEFFHRGKEIAREWVNLSDIAEVCRNTFDKHIEDESKKPPDQKIKEWQREAEKKEITKKKKSIEDEETSETLLFGNAMERDKVSHYKDD